MTLSASKVVMPSAVVVFGASGFIGRNLVLALKEHVPMLLGVTQSSMNVSECSAVYTVDRLHTIPPLPDDTVVVHLAAHRYDSTRFSLIQSDILQQNSVLTGAVFNFCADRHVRELRVASSVAVYSAHTDVLDDAIPIDLMSQPHQGEAFYAWSKRWAEVQAQLYRDRYGLNTVIFRLANPYGAHDTLIDAHAHVASAFVLRALAPGDEFAIRGDERVTRDFTYVGDVVEAFVQSVSWRGRNETYNLCTGTQTTLRELAEVVMRVAGVAKVIKPGAPGAFGPKTRVSTAGRIRAATGIPFRSIVEGMQPTVAWYRDALNR